MRLRGMVLIIIAIFAIPASGRNLPKFWVGSSLGFNTYSMSDFNDYIDAFNAYYDVSIDKISTGMSYGLEAGVQLNSSFEGYIGYEGNSASTKLQDVGGTLTFSYPIDVLFAGAQYTVWRVPRWGFGFAGDIGRMSVNGKETEYINEWGGKSYAVSGDDILLRGLIFADYRAGKVISISPSIGYRHAKMSEYRINGKVVHKADGSNETLDYSGLIVRLTVKFILNPEK